MGTRRLGRVNSRAPLLLLLLAVALVGCDRAAPPQPTATQAPPECCAFTTASPTSTSQATTAPTAEARWPGTPPSPLRGVARPAGRFLVSRDDGLWLVSLTNPSTDRRLYEATGPRWSFAGLAQTPSGPEIVVAEERQSNGPKEVRMMLYRIDLDGGAKTPLFEFGPVRGDFFRWGPVAVSPNGSRIAYAYNGGLYVRDRADGIERLIYQKTDELCGPSQPDCVYPMTPLWSPEGKSLLATGINYEPLQTYLFDPNGATVRSGQRVPICIYDTVWRGAAILGNDGSCYAGPGPRFFWYDVVSGKEDDLGPPPGYEFGSARASNVSKDGEYAVTWARCESACPQGYSSTYRPADIVALYRSDGTIFATIGSGARARLWVPDGSGVVLYFDGSIRFFFIDRAGDQWTLPLDATNVLAILPE